MTSSNFVGITASSIATLRYYSASEAQVKWGSNHPAGAIEVITKTYRETGTWEAGNDTLGMPLYAI